MSAYTELENKFSQLNDVTVSTMMSTPCLRYKGEFIAMMFEKADSLIIKVSEDRVNEIINNGEGNEFNFTKKRFKQWVLIPSEFEYRYEDYLNEALLFTKSKVD